MPKWKKNAREFVVGVNHNEKRGYQCSIPKPIVELLGKPPKIKFLLKDRKRVEVVSAV